MSKLFQSKKTWLLLCLGLAFLSIAYYIFTWVSPETGFIGSEAPDFELPSANGQTIQLSSLHGKSVVLTFWATWCKPCVQEMPDLETLQQKHQDDAIVIAVNQGESAKTVQDFLVSHSFITFSVLIDENKRVNRAYRISSLPITYFIDPKGIIRHIQVGASIIPGIDVIFEGLHLDNP